MNIFWFRRDLRLEDNHGLYQALKAGNTKAIFIFDRNILNKLEDQNDRRVSFIHQEVSRVKHELQAIGSDLEVYYSSPKEVFKSLADNEELQAIYCNHDYEPYALHRDAEIAALAEEKGKAFKSFKDQCILEKGEVLKDDGTAYTVFSPYMRKWKKTLKDSDLNAYPSKNVKSAFLQFKATEIPSLNEMGFTSNLTHIPTRKLESSIVERYHEQRDIPSVNGTTRLSIHLRFGTVSIRQLARTAQNLNEKWYNELIWRDFYMMILWHFPNVVKEAFNPRYRKIEWIHDEQAFEAWKNGKTGYPIVDAGMRELNETGFMHNRVRMVVASFFTKHLFQNWQLGEAYFAQKLNDFELSSNNGGWQWAASTGVDAAPYFRVFNPELQTKKFDPQFRYIQKWVPEFQEFDYPKPIVEHKWARERAIRLFKEQVS